MDDEILLIEPISIDLLEGLIDMHLIGITPMNLPIDGFLNNLVIYFFHFLKN
jgi:hypothetical protein